MQHKINTPSHKCIIGTAPSYACDCLQLYTPSHTLCFYYQSPDSSHQTLHCWFLQLFCLRPLYMWNDLPLPLWTPSDPASNYYFSLKNRPAFPSHCCFLLTQAQFIISKLCVQCVCVCVCVCASCIYMWHVYTTTRWVGYRSCGFMECSPLEGGYRSGGYGMFTSTSRVQVGWM